MANIIRCKLPDGVHRFKPFKVSDYRDFLLIRNDLLTKDESEQELIIEELVGDYFDSYPKIWQYYIFLQVFIGSIGKTKFPINFECPVCGKVHKRIFNLSTNELKNPVIEVSNIKIHFKFPDKKYDEIVMILKSIDKIEMDSKLYNWNDISDKSKQDIISLLDYEKFESIVKSLKPFSFELEMVCCERHKVVYDDMLSLFKLLINPDEVFPFYEINDILVRNNYDHQAVMELLPAERSMILALIERNNKK